MRAASGERVHLDPDNPMFSDSSSPRIEELKKRYQHPQSVVLAALWMWQDEHGWISEEGMKLSRMRSGIPPHHVVRRGDRSTRCSTGRPSGGTRSRCARTSRACSANSDRILKHIQRPPPDRSGRDHARRPVHPRGGRMPRILRHRPDDADRRRVLREPGRRGRSTRILERTASDHGTPDSSEYPRTPQDRRLRGARRLQHAPARRWR